MALSVACSLTSLDGLSGGATATTPDGEAGTPDATTTADASVDAPPSSDAKADAAPFCGTAPAGAFCDDFENGLSQWDKDTTGGNSFAVDDVSSTSETHSALSTVLGDGSSCLRRVFSGTPQSIEVDADVRFDGVSSGSGDYDFMGLRGSNSHNLTLQLRLGVIELDQDIVPTVDGGPDETRASTGYGVDSAWHHVRWANHLTGSTADVEVFVDGKKIGGMVANVLDFASPLSFDLGDCAAFKSGTPWKVRFDNVVVVAK